MTPCSAAEELTPPCPFCGGVSIEWIFIEETGQGYHLCNGCSARGPACYHVPDGLVAGYWGRRRTTGLVNWLEAEMAKYLEAMSRGPQGAGLNAKYQELKRCRRMVERLLGE